MYRSLALVTPLVLVLLAGCTAPQTQPPVTTKQTTQPATTVTGTTRMKAADQRALLQHHNKVRAAVGVGPLRWDDGLAAYAQQWADHLATSTCRMKHRQPNDYGENLYIGTAARYTAIDASQAWASEKKDYRGGVIKEKNDKPVGHYTQMVWRNTKKVGCGEAMCSGMLLVACNYDPPGNWLGEKPY